MTAHFSPTLLLNADYQPLSYFPLSLLSWQDAIKGVVAEKYAVVAEYDEVVRSVNQEFRLPSVVALREYQHVEKRVAFTRFNVFLRDEFTCQYCGDQHPQEGLTFEHVVPRCKGGRTTWDNISAACVSCNTMKADRTDIRPRRMPYQPTIHQLQKAGRKFPPNYLHETWSDFLYWDIELEA